MKEKQETCSVQFFHIHLPMDIFSNKTNESLFGGRIEVLKFSPGLGANLFFKYWHSKTRFFFVMLIRRGT